VLSVKTESREQVVQRKVVHLMCVPCALFLTFAQNRVGVLL